MSDIIYLLIMYPKMTKENEIIKLTLYKGHDNSRINLYENLENTEKHGYDKNDIILNRIFQHKDFVQYFTDDILEAKALSKNS